MCMLQPHLESDVRARKGLTFEPFSLQVWGFGNNAHGELGVGDIIPVEYLPADDEGLGDAEHGVGGIGMEGGGGVGGGGGGSEGRFSTGRFDVRPTPTLCALPDGIRAVRISCGGLHSIVSVSMPDGEGRVYAFGADGGGQLGLGRLYGSQVPLPTEVRELRGCHVTSVTCGMFHSTATATRRGSCTNSSGDVRGGEGGGVRGDGAGGDGRDGAKREPGGGVDDALPVLYSWGMNWFTREARGDRHETPTIVKVICPSPVETTHGPNSLTLRH